MRRIATITTATFMVLGLTACDIEAPKIDLPSTTKSAAPTVQPGKTVPGEVDAALVEQAKKVLPSTPTVPDDFESDPVYKEIDKTYERGCEDGEGCVFGQSWSDDNSIPETGHNGCDTRNDVLWQQLEDASKKPNSKCVVISGTYVEPYFGTVETFTKGEPISGQDEIDHVYSLHMAWLLGAHSWSMDKRMDFANDTEVNLLLTTRAANAGGRDVDGDGYKDRKDLGEYPGKSDLTAAQWMEWITDDARACNFGARYVLVADKYGLPITQGDAKAIGTAFGKCS